MSIFHEQRPKGNFAIPRPENGQTVGVTPPGFVWNPAEGAASYGLDIYDSKQRVVYTSRGITDPVHVPDRTLAPGEYEWDLSATGPDGRQLGRRGRLGFIVPDRVPEFPWVSPQELLSRVRAGHPRLVYAGDNLARVRDTLGTTRRAAWESVRRAADRCVGLEPPPYPTYDKIEDANLSRLEYVKYYRSFPRYVDLGLQSLALAYLVSGEEKYGVSARSLLSAFAEWPVADDNVTSVLAKWGDEPGLHLARIAHRAYDWIYDLLDEPLRRKVLAMCAERARQALRRLKLRHNYLTSPAESHPGRLVAYLSEMAIAMAGEVEDAPEWLEYSLKALMTFYPHWSGADGGWAEGVLYGKNYNSYYIGALEALRTIGLDLWQRPPFSLVRRFFFYCTTPNAEFRPYGDGADRGGANAELTQLLRHHARRFRDAACQWWVDRAAVSEMPDAMVALATEDDVAGDPPSGLPQAAVFRDAGWAALHSDLAHPAVDTVLLFKSSPYGSISHSHADQNSFSLLKGEKALAIPSGYYGPAYGQPHHADWTRQTKANNSILVSGRGQVVRETWASGRITDHDLGRQISYVCGDATEAYAGDLTLFRRHILFVRPALFVVLDELAAPRISSFQWLLHGLEEMETDEEAGTIRVQHRGARLRVRLASPVGLWFKQTDLFETPYNAGSPPAFREEHPNHWHFTASTIRPTTGTRIGAAMLVTAEGEQVTWDTASADGWLRAFAAGPDWSAEAWARLTPEAAAPEALREWAPQGSLLVAGRWARGGERQSLVR